ncbi:MAG: hypothetical protein ACRDZ4_08045 [Egibacteraceae bacterium]
MRDGGSGPHDGDPLFSTACGGAARPRSPVDRHGDLRLGLLDETAAAAAFGAPRAGRARWRRPHVRQRGWAVAHGDAAQIRAPCGYDAEDTLRGLPWARLPHG